MFLSVILAPGAFAQDTLSDEILAQAKAQADLFLELKNALGLDWLDKYNAYLQNPSVNPEPSWSLSIQDLINNGYLSAGFPSDFSLSPSGAEVVISRPVSTQSVRDAITIYLPSAMISGNTVSLLVQRPAQWIAWQDALNGKVSRDGSGDPDILPGAELDFGSGSKIEFVSSDGKILGVDSLTYKGEELENRFVNVSGDSMTGPLYINGNTVWHAGNDGSGSGLDADLLDGKDSTYFTNAGNLASGIVPVARLSGTYNIDISGNAATATNANYATSAGNADTVDGRHASDFALSGHTHGQYVQKSGDTMTGNLSFNSPSNVGIVGNPNTWTKIDPNGQRFIVTIPGSLTDGNPNFPVIDLERTDNWQHLWELKASGDMTVRGNPVWHAGNDGSGSGLDADLLDGKHASGFLEQPIRLPANTNLNSIMTPGMYYTPSDADAKTMANRPTDYAFSLLVEKHAGVKQTLTEYLPNNSARTWFRNYYNGTWGPWIKAANVVEKTKSVSGYWYVGYRDRVEGGRSGGSLAGGGHNARWYYAPNRNASGAKTWYTFDELMTIGSVKSIPNTVGAGNLVSAVFNIEADGCWESAATIQVFERNPSTGQVTTLINKYVSRNYVSGSCTIRKGYEYGIVATLHSVCRESYDDGYRAHAWITSYVYKYYEVQ